MLVMNYPLKVAKLCTLNGENRRAKRLGYSRDSWWKSKQLRYSTVDIVKQGAKWFLCYERNFDRLTGGFPSKQKAIEWYAKGGR